MKRQSKPTIGPVDFIDRVIKRDEKASRSPWRRIGARGALPTLYINYFANIAKARCPAWHF